MATLQQKAEALRKLHAGPRVLVLANAWDVASARLVEEAAFPAIATSSAGVAFALGYPDGQRISRSEMLDMVRRIAAAVNVPVTADVESGYGETPQAAAETARGVVAAGAVGMNLEDTGADGKLLSIEVQADRIRAARGAGEKVGVPIVINARTDAFAMTDLAGEGRIAEAVRRANAYLEAGGDCAFVPFVTDREVIARLVREIRGPINVLGGPGAPPVPELERMGVRRVSIGGGLARAAYTQARRVALELKERGTYDALSGAVTYTEMQKLLGA